METLVPRTPEEFEKYWQTSPEFAALQREILEHEQKFPIGGSKVLDDFKEGRKAMQSKHTRPGSSYTIR
jgi:ATP-binding cassette subfamily G (WHITE) protein 2 (PDR)